ncbi:MAG: ribbon-helix-helix protein, CopG family [Ilumatobacteraceae bacterium]
MRTTVVLDDDTAKAVEQLRRDAQRGMSEAVNELIRRGMLASPPNRRYEPRPRHLGLRIDVSNVAEAIDLLEGAESR